MVGTKEWYLKNKKECCAKAKKRIDEWRMRDPEGLKAYQKSIYLRNKNKILKQKKEYGLKWRDYFFAHYGSACVCCGEEEKTFLTVEHLNGDGKLHREKVRSQNRTAIFIDLKRRGWPREGYTVLCFNCNHGKYMNHGVCPHVEKIAEAFLNKSKKMVFESSEEAS